MLGQLFLVGCVLSLLSIAAIVFILYGPVPVKRSVVVAARISPPHSAVMPSLVSQLAPAPQQHFEPVFPNTIQGAAPPFMATRQSQNHVPTPPPLPPPIVMTPAPPPPPPRKPKAEKVQPMPKKRSARGTAAPSPMAPVVRSRNFREEEMRTNPVRIFETEELTIDESN